MTENNCEPIAKFFPKAFAPENDIMLKQTDIHGLSGLAVCPFKDQVRNHYDDRPRGAVIKYLIIHYTVADFVETMLIETKTGTDRTSYHFIITEKELNKDHQIKVEAGKLLQIVPEEKRAWHAGISGWEQDRNLNSCSIGISLVNAGYTEDGKGKFHWFPFDQEQVKMAGKLSREIVEKYGIKPQHVLSHADIAPNRKQDPGPLFPWGQFHEEFGVGAWLTADERTEAAIMAKYSPKIPLPAKVDVPFFLRRLYEFGYDLSEFNAKTDWHKVDPVLRAFRAHFSGNGQPEVYDVDFVREEDQFWAWALTAKYGLMKH